MIYLFKKMPIGAEEPQTGRNYGNKERFPQAKFQHASQIDDRTCCLHHNCGDNLFYKN